MRIAEKPYDYKFQDEVKQVDITDPEAEKLFFELAAEGKQGKKNLIIADKHREIINEITLYNEDQILQYAAVFLKFSSSADFYAGKIMKQWKEQQETSREESKLVSGTIQVAVSDEVKNTV